MRAFVLIGLLAITSVSTAKAEPPEGRYREIRASLSGGVVGLSGSATRLMKTGPTIGADVGIALSPRVMAGLRLEIGPLESKLDAVGQTRIATDDNDWTWYAAGLFGEYVVANATVAPVIGGRVGIDGIHISYAQQQADGATGVGDFGVGYAAFVGLRYRANPRLGGLLDVAAERCPSTSTGWYFPARAALAIFL
ncbi:MAG: hypothetical protein ACM3JJ_10930 [Hyphomicrobiales bacterium]